jgi:hypothetical protein
MKKTVQTKTIEHGQVLIIFMVSFLALLFFIGLALDAGSVYVTYGGLKRAVDSASIAAANEFKHTPDIDMMTGAAQEVFQLMNVDTTSVEVRICDDPGTSAAFIARCESAEASGVKRKLVWVKAEAKAPLYFLSLLGFSDIPLSTDTISEAAPLDVVIVIDTSESMARETSGYHDNDEYDPSGCNSADSCEPMKKAKDAAKNLIDTLTPGYDQVAVVTFDITAYPIHAMDTDLSGAESDIDNHVQVHDDSPSMFTTWDNWFTNSVYNPMNSEDLDGDGEDYDDPDKLGYTCPFATDPAADPEYLQKRWWTVSKGLNLDIANEFDWNTAVDSEGNPLYADNDKGVPCDRNDVFDSMDLDKDTVWTSNDNTLAEAFATAHPVNMTELGWTKYHFSSLSTCSGCGIRVASNMFKNYGRYNAVWVMVFLSDGTVNLSDTPVTNDKLRSTLANGACGGSMGQGFWIAGCRVTTYPPQRYCADDEEGTCPPDSIWTTTSPSYSVLDYAMDMVDDAALTTTYKDGVHDDEPKGNDIAIYTIGLGLDNIRNSTDRKNADYFLRYMAAVGDDGDRTTDACEGVAYGSSCGQYYFAPNGDALKTVFEDIASRIYTRINQ